MSEFSLENSEHAQKSERFLTGKDFYRATKRYVITEKSKY